MIIYKATNTVNGKVYIGKTEKTLSQRKSQHKANRNRYTNILFYKALNKYGWDSFTWDVIDRANSPEELSEKEIYWISHFNTNAFNGGCGYNSTDGGEGTTGHRHSEETIEKIRELKIGLYDGENNPFYGQQHSDKVKQRMSEMKQGVFDGENNPMYGRGHTEESRNKMSETRTGMYGGENNPMYGKHHSDEAKEKIRKANLEFFKNNPHPSNRAVLQFDLDGNFLNKFDSIKQGAEAVGGQEANIRKVCNGKYKKHKGFVWVYADKYDGDVNV